VRKSIDFGPNDLSKAETPTLKQADLLRKDRHDTKRDNLERCFESAARGLNTIPSPSVLNADETRIGDLKRQEVPRTVASAYAPPGTRVTVSEIGNNAQPTLLSAISAFGDSLLRLFIAKDRAFEKQALTGQQFFEGHDYTIRTAPKTLITEAAFIDWLENVLLLWNEKLQVRLHYGGVIGLIFDGHTANVAHRVLAFAGYPKIPVIQFVPHPSPLAQPFDIRTFGVVTVYTKKRIR
jgi:hypothetical protein